MIDDKKAFFEKYKDCADLEVLEMIWEAQITHAAVLDISHKNILNLMPLEYLTLSQLQELKISDTQVSDLAPLIHLTYLKRLDVSSTQVNDLSSLKDLTQLRLLDIRNTQVSDLSPLKNSQSLQILDAHSTQVQNLSPLKDLQYLQELNISYTKVIDLTPLGNLKFLKYLDISFTQISDLSHIKELVKEGIKLGLGIKEVSDNVYVKIPNLINPPTEVALQGNEAILRYWEEQERGGAKRLNEARLLVVGQGGAGKTTLKEKLKNPKSAMPEPDATTRGIVIEPLNFKDSEGVDFTLQMWDFGGQNIQHYAHQFFMSDSAVYALLSNEREQNPNFQYWLNIIEMLGKESPVVIVRNEKDGHCEPLKNVAQIQERFTNIRSIQSVDLKLADTDPRFSPLKHMLLSQAQLLPHVRKEYPTSFSNVRDKLQQLSENQQVIPFSDFKKLCKDEGIENNDLINDYARTFTILGIALHFHDDIHLKRQVFLRPKWIIDALFKLLYHDKIEQQNGKFDEHDAAQIWQGDEYEDLQGDLLRLMERFELCYPIEGTKAYIVPQRLPERRELFTEKDATQVQYKYKFMPKGMLTRLTCRLHTRIEGDQVWSDAVQFSDKNGTGKVFVREIYNEHTIEIDAFGNAKEALLNTVIDTLDDIHDTAQFANLRVEKLVPCPCNECLRAHTRNSEPYFFKYNFLIKKLTRSGNTKVDCEKSTDEVYISDILKQSGVRVFKVDEIKSLISADKIEEALNLLRGQFPEENDVIKLLHRLNGLQKKHSIDGTSSFDEYNREKNKITEGVLKSLKELF
jgi:internalin A